MRLKLSFFFIFTCIYSWSQTTNTFSTSGSFTVPAGLTLLTAECWGAGGSGSGTSTSTSAGGGGGGGYSVASISVTPNSSISYVVGTGTLGANGIGVSGTASSFSTVSANGGAGGGNSGAGGLGGVGTTFSGGKGSNGSLVLGLIFSGGGGGSAGTAIKGNDANNGSGGLAVAGGGGGGNGATLAGAGSTGIVPGGGGGGGLVLLGIGTNKGGNGANGEIKITYTCPSYSFTGISASNICTSVGNTSTITLNSSASSLPAGNYVVTYNTNNPNATGLTANMVVNGTGTGTFTATGLVTAGSSTITITQITSGTCSSTISSNNTVVVTVSLPSVGGTVTGGTTICSGSPSGLLTLAGHTGSVVKWQYAISPFSSWIDIANTTNATYTSGGLTATTEFRAIVQSGTCATATSAVTTITVNPLPTITASSSATNVCFSTSTQNTSLSYSAIGESPTMYSIVWNASPSNSFIVINNVALPVSPIPIAVPGGTVPGTYTGTLTVKNANGCTSSGTPFTVTVNPLPTITASASTANVCLSTSSQNTSLSYSATTGTPTKYSIVWNASPSNSLVAVTNASLPASPITIAVPANTAVGIYTGTLTVTNANGCISSGTPFTVTVNPLPTITASASTANVCFSAGAQNTSLSYSATTGIPTTYSIVWNASPSNSFVAVTNASLPASPITIAVPANTAAGTYTGTLTVTNANGCTSTGTPFTVTVNPLPTITASASTANVCFSVSSQNTSLAYSATTGAPTTYSIVWNASPSNSFVAVTNASLPASPITVAVPANTAAGTYTGTLTVTNANGCISSGTPFTVTVNPLPTITASPSATSVCFNTSTQNASLSYSATSGVPTTYSIVWNASPSNSFVAINNVALPASPIPIAVPANTAVGTYTGTLTVTNANGCISSGTPFTVTVNSLPTITASPSATSVCFNTSTQNTSLSYSATTGVPTTYSIVWNASPSNSFVAINNVALPASSIPIVVPANTSVGTYTGTLTVKSANGCISSGTPFTVTINALPTIITAGVVGQVCSSSSLQNATIAYTATVGTPTGYSIDWDATANTNLLADQLNTSFSFLPTGGNINTIVIPANTVAGTYSGIMTITNGICTNVQAVSITINSTMPPVIGLVTSLTCDVSYGSVALSGLPSGNWSIVTNPVTVTTTGSGTNTVITNLAPNTYTFTVSNSVTGCTSVASATATVGGIVTNYWDGSEWTSNTPTIDQNIVFGGNYNSQAGSGGDLNGCTCQVNSGVKVVFNSGATLSIVKAVNVSTAVGTSLTFMNNASLFQKNNVSNSGNVIYKRTSTAMNALDYSYWSSPVSGQKFNLLSPNSDPQKLYSYNSGWISEAPTNSMKIGKGYIIRVPRVGTWPNGEVVSYPYSQPVSFVGTPNNGNITGETITVLDDSYLIGNPYPSAIDAKAFLTANKLILEGTLYFWTHNTPIAYDGAFEKIYTANDYAVYNFTGGTATSAALNPGVNNAVPLGLIASGQSFFAYSIASSGTIVFNNDMRVVGNNAQFFRSSKETKEAVTKEARLWLNLKNTNGFFKQVLIGYIDGATNEFESKFDGTKFDVEQMADLYSIVSDRKLTIQGRALPFEVTDKVVLGYSSEIKSNYTIAIDRSDGLLANQDVYLEDKTLGTIHNLTQTGYTFSTAIGTFDDRFTLLYTNGTATLGTAELDTSKKLISVVVENQEIKVNGFDQKIDEVFIYDMSGRLIYKKEKIENSKLIIENLKSSNQILLVKVILDDNRTEIKKVIF